MFDYLNIQSYCSHQLPSKSLQTLQRFGGPVHISDFCKTTIIRQMKIIDNKKDYYDYISGIYGIDDLAVYDRRSSVVLISGKTLLQGLDHYFSTKILFTDKPLSEPS